MLDDVTKRRINTLKDILVGKLPDPKAQVEQITNGLIYKFMNDMDEESISLGGKPSFFTKKYEKYSWKNLMNPKTTGSEKVQLYSEAIEQFYNNENLPELFREIFKNSFLPFKDPSTLNMFLNEINEFNYSNSERLGDAFEFLLSSMGSQGDAGQFRTPRHIIDFIVEIVNPQKNETILDPACGTAGFLISSYKHILNQNTKKNLGDSLTASERKKIGENLNGYDISPDMVKMSLVNMYLHKFSNPKINEYDTLSSEDRWNEYYDVILANPPFFSPKGGITPHNRFGVNSSKAEVLFVDYINEHLKPNGRAGIIVPDGIINQNGSAYKQLRKKLIETSLIGVVSLPSGVFKPYSGVTTFILILDKTNSKKLEEIIFLKVDNDGYSLGAQRKQIEENDLPKIIEEFKNIYEKNKKSHKISKLDLLHNENYSLNYSNYEFENNLVNANNIKLNNEKYFLISSGGTPKSDENKYWGGNINWITLADLPQKEFISLINNSKRKITEVGLKNSSAKIIPKNSIIVSTRATLGRVAVNNVELATNQGFKSITIKDNNNISYKYVAYLMKSLEKQMNSLATGGTFKELSKTAFGNLEIPLLPIEDQNQIVKELDSYQKIIDGCKQVIENYKPSFNIKKDWKNKKIKEISNLTYGLGQEAKEKGKYRIIRITDINENGLLIESDKKYVDIKNNEKKYILKKEDVLVARTGATYGKCLFFESNEPSVYAGYLIKLEFDKEIILPKFFWIFSQSENFNLQKRKLVVGSGQPQFNANTLGEVVVPIPSLKEQEEIISLVLEEQKIVSQNLNLLKKFEIKINERLNSIWSK